MSEAPITVLLERWGAGDECALEQLMRVTYTELRRLAVRHMRQERLTHTLQPTALVHEAFLRLVDQKGSSWRSRSQFFCLASQLMRRILVDQARRRLSAKRGGRAVQLTLDELELELEQQGGDESSPGGLRHPERLNDVLAIDAALRQLEALDERQARIVELRFFAGLEMDEIAQALQLSSATIKRDWTMARAWLSRALAAPGASL